jgi:formylglycine-generating enzyme required for sulfatase activity
MGSNPSQFAECGLRCPVETVSYFDIQEFIGRLEARSGGNRFRLPTEAEWEFACRAGTDSPFSTGATITSEQANFDGLYPYNGGPGGTFRESPVPVGSYPPNPWGFYDLHGNVWEWCEDWYDAYPEGEVRDPTGPAAGTLRVIRGGSWYFDANSARSALRYTHAPQDSGFSLGFRLVREATPP